MTIIQLEYIVAVDTYRHFATAAEKCFVTQPTLSMQIQKLEEMLGITIFDRSKHPVVPTDIGKKIIEQARIILAETRKVPEIIDTEKDIFEGELKLGIIPTIAPYLLPLFVSQFLEKYPAISLRVNEMLTDKLIRQLHDEELDAGILVMPEHESSLRGKVLYRENFMAYVSERHPFYSSREIRVDDIDVNDLWLLNEGHCFRDQVLHLCPDQKSTYRHFEYESGSLQSVKNIVDRQGGMTLLPSMATIEMSEPERKRLRKLVKPEPYREVSLVVKRSFLKERFIKAMTTEILDHLPINMKKLQNGMRVPLP